MRYGVVQFPALGEDVIGFIEEDVELGSGVEGDRIW